jgi:hypothetical protein
MGVMIGYNGLPQTVKDELRPYMDRDYNFTTLSIRSASVLSNELALENISDNGGSIRGEDIVVPIQTAEHQGPCEVSFYDFSFVDIYTLLPELSPELNWRGSWQHPDNPGLGQREKLAFFSSDNAGDYLEVPFSGTCVYVQGNLHENFGILEAYVDGQLLQTRDMYIRKQWNGHVQATAVWITGLEDTSHILRVVVSGRKNPSATGTEIQLGRVVSYRGEIPPLPEVGQH